MDLNEDHTDHSHRGAGPRASVTGTRKVLPTGRRSAVRRGSSSTSPLLTISEVAQLMGVHRSTLYRTIGRAALPLPVIRVGATMRVPRVAVERLLSGDLAHGMTPLAGHVQSPLIAPSADGLPSEQPTDVSAGTVLLADGGGVVARDVGGGPAKTGLLLAFGDNGVNGGRLEMSQRVKMQFGGHTGGLSRLRESMGKRVGMQRLCPAWLRRENEARLLSSRTSAIRCEDRLARREALRALPRSRRR